MKPLLEMKRQFSGERENMLYSSLPGLVSSALGTLTCFSSISGKAKIPSVSAREGSVGAGAWWLCSLASPCSSAPGAWGTAPLLLLPHVAQPCFSQSHATSSTAPSLAIRGLVTKSSSDKRKEGFITHLNFGRFCRNFD